MLIEVLEPGETIWMIARRYGVSVDALVRLNGISDPMRLVAGQALVVPTDGRTHTVRAGETLWQIARRYGVSPQSLIELNNIPAPDLIFPGEVLRIPRAPRIEIEANAYLQTSGAARDRRLALEAAPALTYVSIFEYRVLESGELEAPEDGPALAAIGETDAVPMMVIANFREGNFSPDIARAVFTDPAARSGLIEGVADTMRIKGYRALNIDFENLYPADRELYNAFLRDITERLHREGFLVSTALAPKVSATQRGQWYEAHDYPAHGEIVDFVVLMTYEWGWSGGPPMAVAPIPQVRQVLDYAVSAIPPGKILMGAPLYGYDWTLPFVQGGEWARTLGPLAAVEQAAAVGAAIQFDPVAQAPYYTYYDRQGREHVVWFEDARSMQAKFNLIREYGLRGISYWVLGNPFPQNWALLLDEFFIRKI